ncbi:hypothetical protein E4633_14345 [Geomonas terrae]|jgi:hypothetical protein|uniref:Uncharacterized protein n=1 Tax=Geomonas terrae TaxID=2562681 RepID=A0A4S1CDF8_9BACT|nr:MULTISPECIES: hypothetical protein [Geomonas]TGU71495.1 hypothetical protein E4633_14345 [Geomonas terrae]
MLIQVSYNDDRYDYVKDFMLEPLIKSGAITRFRRRSGWVRIGVDPVRAQRNTTYSGEERRTGTA